MNLKGKRVNYFCYGIMGDEHTQEGRQHWQCYFQLSQCVKLGFLKNNVSSRMHWIPANGTAQQNITYCSKEDTDPWIFGVPKLTKKESGKLRGAETIRLALMPGTTWIDVVEEAGSYAFQHKTQVEGLIRQANKRKHRKAAKASMKLEDLLAWQRKQYNHYLLQDNRTILWMYDKVGCLGKTHLLKFIALQNGGIYFENGKRADLTRYWDYQPYAAVNFTRDKEGIACYSFLESLKDGAMFSSKYEPESKITNIIVRVIVAANWLPQLDKMNMAFNQNNKTVQARNWLGTS